MFECEVVEDKELPASRRRMNFVLSRWWRNEEQAMGEPRFLKDKAYLCLRVGDFDGFHAEIADRKEVDFSDADLRAVDFRRGNLDKVVMRGAYLRDADLRGMDLRRLDLEGCSLLNAKVSGTYFPANLSAEEIQMSLQHGTRLRTSR
jgi:hypothetical protein